MHHKSGQACVTNWGSFVLLKLGQTLLQNRAAIQIGAKCITNWGRYYNLYTLEHFL